MSNRKKLDYKTDTVIGRLYENLRYQRKYLKRSRIGLLFAAGIIISVAFNLGYPGDDYLLYFLPVSAWVIIAYVFIDIIYQIPKKKEVRDLLAAHYTHDLFLTMQIREPKGKDPLEKFLDLAAEALPPLKIWMLDHNGELIPTTTLTDDYKLDIYIETEEGIFLLKYKSVVTMKDVEEFHKKIEQHYDEIKNKHLLRAILLGKEFDSAVFYNVSLEDEMKNLREKYNNPKIDLFLDKDVKFQPIWISRHI